MPARTNLHIPQILFISRVNSKFLAPAKNIAAAANYLMTKHCAGYELRGFAPHEETMSFAIPTGYVVAAVLLTALVLSGIRIAQEYHRAIVFRLGRYHSVRGPGLYYNIPLLEWQRKVDMRTITVDVERQETITKDSVTVKVNAVLWYRVVDPRKAILDRKSVV